MSRKKVAFYAYLILKNAEFLDIVILMRIQSSMLSWVYHENCCITLGPESFTTFTQTDPFVKMIVLIHKHVCKIFLTWETLAFLLFTQNILS